LQVVILAYLATACLLAIVGFVCRALVDLTGADSGIKVIVIGRSGKLRGTAHAARAAGVLQVGTIIDVDMGNPDTSPGSAGKEVQAVTTGGDGRKHMAISADAGDGDFFDAFEMDF
jgi:hypothetical protein